MTRKKLGAAGLATVVAIGVAFALKSGRAPGGHASGPSRAAPLASVAESLHVGDEVFAVEPDADAAKLPEALARATTR